MYTSYIGCSLFLCVDGCLFCVFVEDHRCFGLELVLGYQQFFHG